MHPQQRRVGQRLSAKLETHVRSALFYPWQGSGKNPTAYPHQLLPTPLKVRQRFSESCPLEAPHELLPLSAAEVALALFDQVLQEVPAAAEVMDIREYNLQGLRSGMVGICQDGRRYQLPASAVVDHVHQILESPRHAVRVLSGEKRLRDD